VFICVYMCVCAHARDTVAITSVSICMCVYVCVCALKG